ncbi:MAG: hypothetical protein GF381_02095 [Candidatus Pacebacteria bacterium]|nr:hypothetical protein [Candidatus Paceibacterota bacterium]
MKKILIGLLLIALLLRLPQLNGSFWLDEAAQALESARPLSQQLDIVPDFQPPLLHLITHLAIQLSQQEWWLRLIGALIPGLITIWATIKIGQKIFNSRTGLIAGFLLSTSSFHIFYSQELRPYSLPTMIAALSWLTLTSLFFRKKEKHFDQAPTQKKLWVIFTLLTAVGLYSSYLYPFLLFSQLLFVIFFKRHYLKQIFFSTFIASILFVPWLPTFFKQLQAGQELRQTIPGWESIVSIPQAKALLLTIGKLVFGIVDLEVNFRFVSLCVLLLIGTLVLLLKPNKKLTQTVKLALVWFVTPLLTAWIVSFAVPVVRPKRLLLIQPGLYLFFGSLIAHGWQSARAWSRAKIFSFAFFLLLTAINLSSSFQYFVRQEYQRENWRSLYQEIETRFPEAETVVVFSFEQPFAPWSWYNQNKFPTLSTGFNNFNQVQDLTATLKPVYQYQYVLIFDYLRDLTDPADEITKTVESFGYQPAGVIDRHNIGFVRIHVKEAQLSSFSH